MCEKLSRKLHILNLSIYGVFINLLVYLNLGQKIFLLSCVLKIDIWGFPGGSVVKNPPANAGDTGSIPDLGRSHIPQSN